MCVCVCVHLVVVWFVYIAEEAALTLRRGILRLDEALLCIHISTQTWTTGYIDRGKSSRFLLVRETHSFRHYKLFFQPIGDVENKQIVEQTNRKISPQTSGGLINHI